VNPAEREATHPVNPFVVRAAADRELEEAFTFSQVLAVDVARPVGAIAHRRESPPVLGVVALVFALAVMSVVTVFAITALGGAA